MHSVNAQVSVAAAVAALELWEAAAAVVGAAVAPKVVGMMTDVIGVKVDSEIFCFFNTFTESSSSDP
eukprot:1730820-Amphidinium_carterae.1